MDPETPKKKISGVLLPADGALEMRRVTDGLYVAVENPYTEKYGFFDPSGLYGSPKRSARQAETAETELRNES